MRCGGQSRRAPSRGHVAPHAAGSVRRGGRPRRVRPRRRAREYSSGCDGAEAVEYKALRTHSSWAGRACRSSAAPPRAPTGERWRRRHDTCASSVRARPRDAPFASIARAADATLDARAPARSTSSALEEALDARERRCARRLRPRVWAPASPRFSTPGRLDAVAAEAGCSDARGRDATESGWRGRRTGAKAAESVPSAARFSSLPRVEGLSESQIALARSSPCASFASRAARCRRRETRGRRDTRGGGELARAFERRRARRTKAFDSKKRKTTHVRYERLPWGASARLTRRCPRAWAPPSR